MAKKAASPTAAGPAGARFEAKVGAYYLLAMLLESEPRGLPGAGIQRIQLQAASDGHPLDDVIVHTLTPSGSDRVLEIQAKRKITFSPGDTVFADVLGQIADVVKSGRLQNDGACVLGIATAQGSRQIDGAYQEVLLGARNALDAAGYFRRLARPMAANDSMRAFITTVRDTLTALGARSDDDTVWMLLQNLQILVFDFAAVQGQTEALVLERCRQALDANDAGMAGALWSSLTDIAQEVAEAGGQIDTADLRRRLISEKGLRLAGLRQNRTAIAALSEASFNAIQDVRNRVADVALARRARLDMVYGSLDRGRYVQILGDAGVGKSGVLRSLAEQAAMRGSVIFLSPARTPSGGWNALRRDINFQGSCADLLNDVAASGDATLFVDSMDFFEDAKRATVNDLVREAASIPGFSVVVTARRSFGAEEPNWLDSAALDTLGRAPPVVIDELNDEEVQELRSEAPQLVPLLAEGHAARDVVRNLFRLDRLVRQGQGAHVPRTEAEMARLWWNTGDGANDAQMRDRTRILRGLAGQSLPGHLGTLDTSGFQPVLPLDALVASGTLKDMGGERMLFRHDVFRDWAVANLLHEDSATHRQLPLSRPAPASLFRGVDIAARMAIEDSPDGKAWAQLLTAFAKPGVHGSWKRAVIVALVRSELSADALTRAESALLGDNGSLLRELIRTVMALDVMPLGELLSGYAIPEGLSDLTMPVGPTWHRLIVWILVLKDRLPNALIPDVTQLYVQYATAAWHIDTIVIALVTQLHAWLMAMDGKVIASDGPALAKFGYEDRHAIHAFLRSAFAGLASVRPDLAETYLAHLLTDLKAAHTSAEAIVMAPGNLAKAAPAALAEITARILIESPKPRIASSFRHDDPDAFSHTDNKFLSPSPARGPFLGLLQNAPKTGLALIRQLVTHACTFRRGSDVATSDNALIIELPTGPRRFLYPGSYYWSRDGGGYYCTTSALMALEAWAHMRMDAGEEAAAVIADILGDDDAPAAFLLVAVDIILSHFAKAWEVGIPFVGNPQLLAWDRSRKTHDQMGDMRMFGEKEPPGSVTRESLKNRDSRGVLLERALPVYVFNAAPDCLAQLRKCLQSAAASLGPYEPHSDYGDPRFMARYALNVTDRANYQSQEMIDSDGNKKSAFAYQPPPDEAAHMAAMQATRSSQMDDANLRASVSLALDSHNRGGPDLVAKAVPWARDLTDRREAQADFDHSVLIAAYLLMRDGNPAQRAEYGAWAQEQFDAALAREEDGVHRMREGLNFNPVGLGTAGTVLSLYHDGGLSGCLPLLQLAARGDPAAAHGFGAVHEQLAAIDPRLPRSVLRCAFAGNIRAHLKRYDKEHAAVDAARIAEVTRNREAAVEAEWSWLQGRSDEPLWPVFPDPELNVREPMYVGRAPNRRARAPKPDHSYYADHQAAAIWLGKFLGNDLVASDWLRPVGHAYSQWTSILNGAGLDSEQELAREPHGWNSTYFRLVARSLTGLDARGIDGLCLTPVLALPDEPFLGVAADLQFALDVVYFRDAGLSAQDALRLRTALIDRMKKTSQWQNFARRPGYGIPFHLDGALGTAFMCMQDFRQPPNCYVTALGMHRANEFMPGLTALAEATPSLFTAKAALSIVTVSPDFPFPAFGVKAISACMQQAPNDTKFWLDYGVGTALCSWLAGVIKQGGVALLDQAGVRGLAEKLTSDLIRLGVPQATALERDLAGQP